MSKVSSGYLYVHVTRIECEL